MRRSAFAGLCVALVGGACFVAPLPSEFDIRCASDGECPTGTVCSAALSRCVHPGADQTPPGLDGAPVVEPTRTKPGGVVDVRFAVDEDVGAPPTMQLVLDALPADGGAGGDAVLADSAGREFHFSVATDDGAPDGFASLVVTLVDAVGNVGRADLPNAFLVDATGPLLLDGAPGLPGYAEGDVGRYIATFSEALDGAPTIHVTAGVGAGARTLAFAADDDAAGATTYIYHALAPFSPGDDGAWTVAFDAVDVAGNNSVGLVGAPLSVDSTAPAVTALTVTPNAIGPLSPVAIAFHVDESVDIAGGLLLVRVGLDVVDDCVATDDGLGDGGVDVACTYALDTAAVAAGDVQSGIADVNVTAFDAAGNAGRASTALIIDVDAPTLAAPANLARDDGAARANLHSDELFVSPARVDGNAGVPLVFVSFALGEPSSLEPVVHVAGDADASVVFNASLSSGTFYSFTFTPLAGAGGEPDRAAEITVDVADAVGNAATRHVGVVHFDASAPALPQSARDALVLVRKPWGDAAGGPSVSVETSPPGAPGVLEPDTELLVYGGADPVGDVVIARHTVGADGSITAFALPPQDRATAFLDVVDRAGNRASANGASGGGAGETLLPVLGRGRYVVSLRGKQPGDVRTNPHDAVASVAVAPQTAARQPATARTTLDAAGFAALATQDGTTVASAAAAADSLSPLDDTFRTARALTYDVDAGAVLGIDLDASVRLWDGQRFRVAPSAGDPEGDGDPPFGPPGLPIVAYDDARHVVVAWVSDISADTESTWEWDGGSWRAVAVVDPDGDGDPPPRTEAAFAYDSARGVAVLFGGTTDHDATPCDDGGQPQFGLGVCPGSDVWEYDGAVPTWRRARIAAASAAEPPGLNRAVFVDDRSDGALLLFGGVTLFDPTRPSCPAPLRTEFDIAGNFVVCESVHVYRWDGAAFTEIVPSDATLPPTSLLPQTWFDDDAGAIATVQEAIVGGNGVFQRWQFNVATALWRQRPPSTGIALLNVPTGVTPVYDVATHQAIAATFEGVFGDSDTGWLALDPPPPLDLDDDEGVAVTSFRLRGQLIAMGGVSSTTSRSTWIWDGGAWNELPAFVDPGDPEISTEDRMSPILAEDEDRGVVVMMGGAPAACNAGSNENCVGTWEWNGAAWVDRVDVSFDLASGAQLERYDSVGAWDAELAGVVAFSGWDCFSGEDLQRDPAAGTEEGDTLAYDGRQWASLVTADPEGDGDPPGRRRAAMVYDRVRHKVVLFGGVHTDGEQSIAQPFSNCFSEEALNLARGDRMLGDTWEFDGVTSSWTQVVPVDPESDGDPEPRFHPTLTFDEELGRVLLFGGMTSDGVTATRLSDVWSYDGTSWRRVDTVGADGNGDGGLGRCSGAGSYDVVSNRDVIACQRKNGSGSVANATMLFTGDTDARRPGVVATFDLGLLGVPFTAVNAVDVRAVAGGTSAAAGGAVVRALDTIAHAFVDSAANSAATGAPAALSLSVNGAAARALVDASTSTLTCAVTPANDTGPGGAGSADVAVDEIEASVEYASPSSP